MGLGGSLKADVLARLRWLVAGALVASAVGVLTHVAAAPTGTAHTTFSAIDPVKVLDTRDGTGGVPVGRLAAEDQVTITLSNVLAGADAVVLDVAAVSPTVGTDIYVWPADRPRRQPAFYVPTEATPKSIAHHVVIHLTDSRALNFYNHLGRTHLTAYVVGWYTEQPLPGFACAAGQVIVGFDSEGRPTCGPA